MALTINPPMSVHCVGVTMGGKAIYTTTAEPQQTMD